MCIRDRAKPDVTPLIMCPTEYNKSWSNPKGNYLTTLGEKLNPSVPVSYTHLDVYKRQENKREKEKPFCLLLHHKAPHRTWMPDTCDLGAFDKVKFCLLYTSRCV